MKKEISRQRAYQIRKLEQGLCPICSKPLAVTIRANGTTKIHKLCEDHRIYQQNWRKGIHMTKQQKWDLEDAMERLNFSDLEVTDVWNAANKSSLSSPVVRKLNEEEGRQLLALLLEVKKR